MCLWADAVVIFVLTDERRGLRALRIYCMERMKDLMKTSFSGCSEPDTCTEESWTEKSVRSHRALRVHTTLRCSGVCFERRRCRFLNHRLWRCWWEDYCRSEENISLTWHKTHTHKTHVSFTQKHTTLFKQDRASFHREWWLFNFRVCFHVHVKGCNVSRTKAKDMTMFGVSGRKMSHLLWMSSLPLIQ